MGAGLFALETTPNGDAKPGAAAKPVVLRGANWFGYNTAYGGPEGLWIPNAPDVVSDYFAALRQLRALGFNTLRLPFHFGDLEQPAASAKGPPLARCRRLSDWQVRRRVTDPRVWQRSAATLGPLPNSPVTPADADALVAKDVAAAKETVRRGTGGGGGGGGGQQESALYSKYEALKPALSLEEDAKADPSITRCNAGFPGRFPFAAPGSSDGAKGPQPAVLDRYLWTVQAAVAHGFYVAMSYHPTGASGRDADRSAADSWGPAGFAAAWLALWRRVSCLPNFGADLKGRLLLDLMNEPDALGMGWGQPLSVGGDLDAAVRAAVSAGWTQEPGTVSGSVKVLPPPTAAAMAAARSLPGFAKPVSWAALAMTAMQALYSVTTPSQEAQQAWGKVYKPPPSGAALPGLPARSSPAASNGAIASALAAADAAAAAPPPPFLVLIEGTGQTNLGLNWGNGFSVDPGVLTSRNPPASDARPFFKGLLLSSPALRARVALSPHAYPPTITRGPNDPLSDVADLVGGALWRALDYSFGFAMKAPGVCASGGASPSPPCAVFPVVLGEFGSRFVEPADLAWLEDVAGWLKARMKPWSGGSGASGGSGGSSPSSPPSSAQFPPAPLAGWAVWAYNANSGDTGGIVKSNWHGVEWPKIRFLVSVMGLRPWYAAAPPQQQGGAGALQSAAAGAGAPLKTQAIASGGREGVGEEEAAIWGDEGAGGWEAAGLRLPAPEEEEAEGGDAGVLLPTAEV
jgi:hypothetical protein